MTIKFKFVLIIFLSFHQNCRSEDDLYSSITALEKVFQTDQIILAHLQKFIESSEMKISALKSDLYDYKLKSKNESTHNEINAHNQIDILRLTNKLIQKKKNIYEKTKHSIGKSLIENLTNLQKNYSFPVYSDLDGVILGIFRLQDIYNITAENFANGNFLGKQSNSMFSSSDCYQVGHNFFQRHQFDYAAEWFKEALTKLPNETSQFKSPVRIDQLLDFLSYSLYKTGKRKDVEESIFYAKNALELNPNNYHVRQNLVFFQLKLNKLQKNEENDENKILSEDDIERLLMIQGCRDKLKKRPADLKELHCKYENSNHPFLKLAPIKIEIANLDPMVAIFHDVIYDNEINILKNLSLSKLVRAAVLNATTGSSKISDVRTSKLAWFADLKHSLMKTINQRLSDMTGLSMETAEQLQVMNYGIGGHYDMHPDYFLEPDDDVAAYGMIENGNRIATTLFYLSDVEQGGYTVFPRIKTIVKPKKGTAAFWYNTFLSGVGDKRSRHAACPVVLGSKWVANKWIRARSQEFRKPCKLNNDAKDSDISI